MGTEYLRGSGWTGVISEAADEVDLRSGGWTGVFPGLRTKLTSAVADGLVWLPLWTFIAIIIVVVIISISIIISIIITTITIIITIIIITITVTITITIIINIINTIGFSFVVLCSSFVRFFVGYRTFAVAGR